MGGQPLHKAEYQLLVPVGRRGRHHELALDEVRLRLLGKRLVVGQRLPGAVHDDESTTTYVVGGRCHARGRVSGVGVTGRMAPPMSYLKERRARAAKAWDLKREIVLVGSG